MLIKEIFVLLAVACLSTFGQEGSTDFDPMENPDLFEGDILLGSEEDRNAVVDKRRLWPRGIIPYVIADRFTSEITDLIELAMQDYEDNTCIRFVPRTTEANYVKIFQGQGCYSTIGMASGEQGLSLGGGCGFRGTILHELGHAIGFHHEHNRSDRDGYVDILWNNVRAGMESQFTIRKPNRNWLITPFDYDSVMLYGSYTFSKDRFRLKTMLRKDGGDLEPTLAKPLSPSDIVRVKTMYNCS